jgi:DNA-directed RNA polymerase specialized sigma24 family protein
MVPLHALADTDAPTSRVVKLRFFGGFSVDEVAAILKVSPQTVFRNWRLAKAWLRREMKRGSRARR